MEKERINIDRDKFEEKMNEIFSHGVLSFQYEGNERNDIGIDEWMKEHLSPDDFEFWQQQEHPTPDDNERGSNSQIK